MTPMSIFLLSLVLNNFTIYSPTVMFRGTPCIISYLQRYNTQRRNSLLNFKIVLKLKLKSKFFFFLLGHHNFAKKGEYSIYSRYFRSCQLNFRSTIRYRLKLFQDIKLMSNMVVSVA